MNNKHRKIVATGLSTVIVCEHLNFSGSKKKGEKAQQLHMWKWICKNG